MDFSLSDEQQLFFDTAYQFGQSEIAPHAQKWEQEGTIPRAVMEQAGELGFGAMFASEEHGGSGLSRLDASLIFEALSMACPSVAAFVSIHNLASSMISQHGSEALKAKWIPKLASAKIIASYCLTEPSSGSDAASLRTKAEDHGDHYVLNGSKAFISGGGYSDLYMVMCRTGAEGPKGISCVLVENGTEGLSFGAPERKMGWRSQPTSIVQFDNCKVPKENLLGVEGQGFVYAMKGLDGGRINISSSALGAAQEALNKAIAYMKERKAFGKSLDQFQALQFRLADMEIELQAARVFLRQSAWKLDQKHHDATAHVAMAKRLVTDTSFKVANEALQLLGGYGYLEDYGIEKIVRDLRVHQILEGTNEIMRLITARHLLER